MSRWELIEKAEARLSREVGRPETDAGASVRFALAFPNVYRVGMASLGFHLVHQMLNAQPGCSCERVFLPDRADIKLHEKSNVQLFSLESQTELRSFHAVAFSIAFEMDYTNVLQMLRLAGIPARSSERDESSPLIIAGGACATFNPEPLADLIDAFVIGDAEAVIPELVHAVEPSRELSRAEVFRELAQIPGVYVPRFYHPEYAEDVTIERVVAEPPAPAVVTRSLVGDLAEHPNRSTIRTCEAEFGDIELVEIARGCGRRCRFCVAGHINRPFRPRAIDSSTQGIRQGLVASAVFDHPEAEQICRSIVDNGGEFTVSAVRLETVDAETAKLLAAGGQKTLTIAPEAGSVRLRRVINKDSTEQQMFSAISAAQEAGIKKVKLYFMIGLPTETDEDIDAIVDLVRRLADEYPGVGFQVSASCFVPKPWTVFQWHPMEDESTLKRRYAYLRHALGSVKRIKFSGESPRLSVVQGYLARGDRRMGAVLLAAFENGGNYPKAVREAGVDPGRHLYRERFVDEVLPWDHIDVGIDRQRLWDDYQTALQEAEAPSK